MSSASEMPTNGDAKPSSPVDLSTIPISPGGQDKSQEKSSTGATGQEQITVFHDPDNFNVKHPLMHKWTLWFTKPPSGKVGITDEILLNWLYAKWFLGR